MVTFTISNILFFALGIIVQALSLAKLYSDFRGKISRLVICLLVAGCSFLPFRHEMIYILNNHILVSLFVFCLAFALIFMKEILPPINEQTLLIFTMIFWYAWISFMGIEIFQLTIFKIALIPTAGVLFLAFTPFKMSSSVRICLYIWFLIIITSVSFILFKDFFVSLFFQKTFPGLNGFEAFLYGGVTLYMMANIFYLFYLIPIPGKHQSLSERIEQWEEYVNLLGSKYSNKQLKYWKSVLWIVILGGILVMNYKNQYIAVATLINISIFLAELSGLSYGETNEEEIVGRV